MVAPSRVLASSKRPGSAPKLDQKAMALPEVRLSTSKPISMSPSHSQSLARPRIPFLQLRDTPEGLLEEPRMNFPNFFQIHSQFIENSSAIHRHLLWCCLLR